MDLFDLIRGGRDTVLVQKHILVQHEVLFHTFKGFARELPKTTKPNNPVQSQVEQVNAEMGMRSPLLPIGPQSDDRIADPERRAAGVEKAGAGSELCGFR